MNGLLAVVLEDHIQSHLVDAEQADPTAPSDAKDILIEVVHSYFK